MASSAYANVRAAIADEGSDARVEVNQRALIDKVRFQLRIKLQLQFQLRMCIIY